MQAYYDKMPTAGEQVWDDLDGQANGIAGMSTTNTLGYTNTFAGIGISAAYNKDAGVATEGSSKSFALTSSDLWNRWCRNWLGTCRCIWNFI